MTSGDEGEPLQGRRVEGFSVAEALSLVMETSPELAAGGARAAVLGATIRHLLERDEAHLRLQDMTRAAGLSTTPVYTYFRSRQGLVDAAYFEIYRAVMNHSRLNLERLGSEVDSRATLAARWSPGGRDPEELRRDAIRRRLRLMVLAKTLTRPKLAVLVQEEHRCYEVQLASTFERWRAEGIITSPLSARQLAAFHVGTHIIRAVDEALEGPLAHDEWEQIKALVFGLDLKDPS